ncbi:type III secretion system stalk subunit SctO [Rhizobium etli]|uniref:Uncharacterized protein n=1 Tax=Rhizobium etli TaxID=29449 RepID=A0A7W6ZNR4_RHIET|nr:YscO family type III secretion system apparatus protein [Rhizobium etli]AJC82192.1 type III secretion system YscO family protein [Rhizobium etli bv. phaseoli str. IE4803]MBB4483477.1 hypothetical protein [Rhizobium etli]MBB4539302.1 hypothetical protein [Rhizobium etli]
MIPEAVYRLLQLNEKRSHRAAVVLRLRQTALDNAVAAVESASTDLRRWREDRIREETGLYEPLIGKVAALIDLEEVNSKVASLRQYEQLLEKCLEEARAEADEARQAREEANRVAREALRGVSKFEDLFRALRTAAILNEERATDLELEDFTRWRNGLGRNQDSNLSVKLRRMWSNRRCQ